MKGDGNARAWRLARALAAGSALLIVPAGLAAQPLPQGSAASPAPPAMAAAAAAQAVLPAQSQGAREILARARASIIQVKGFFGTNSAQAFHGTGFAVREGGVFLTNYHVVASQVQQPGSYRLEFVAPDGSTGAVTVLAVDVRHDLALVQAAGHAPPPLTLDPRLPAKGERAYSVGFPLDVGLTITEGVANGRVEEAFEPRIHYSGAINSGMSGGPAFNAAGDVVGVNVSGYRFQQSVSFLVPAEHAAALRDRAGASGAAALKSDIQAQMHAHSDALLGAIPGPLKTQSLAGYVLPAKIAPFIECVAPGEPASDQPFKAMRTSCSAKASVYLSSDLTTGNVEYMHTAMTTDRLGAWRFTAKLSSLTQGWGRGGNKKHVGPYACQDEIVGLTGFTASVLLCMRSYREIEGLYDFQLRVASLGGTQHGMVSQLRINGLSYAPAMAFIQRYLAAMEWKP